MKVLLIEDDCAYASVLARRLSKHQLHVEHCETNTDALLMVRKFLPDVILLDMYLAGDSGLPLISPIKHLLPNSRIILLTGYASIATAVEAIKLGADDYLAKPIDTDTLLKTLKVSNNITADEQILIPDKLSAEQAEWEYIQQVLKANEGNISAAARHLSMHRRTLQRKLKKRPSFHQKS
ncbi:response regulator transcription factor [Thalassotalea sp. PP2-459]|uniref:response regulator transcription factor n=1 Tax=Thalassotalea sp. PP2-459 TaxID=1742724 RepID=UPI0009451C87|nr:response regulator [Thalassotalea sp. PP2-459]OKY27342.1 two-component system response regulator [Thalassotalea sp. PP2-459]